MRAQFYVSGVLLVLLAVMGFFLPRPLFGVLPVTLMHDAAHLAAGIIAVSAAARGLLAMRMSGRLLGAGFAVLATVGFVMDSDATAWLHVAVALFFLYHALLAPPTL